MLSPIHREYDQASPKPDFMPLPRYADADPINLPPDWNFGSEGEGEDGCRMVSLNMAAFMDGELDLDQNRVIALHLDRCSRCAAEFNTLQKNDLMLQREWQKNMPLPSSFPDTIDAIMMALPLAPAMPVAFASKRVHVKTRWNRLSGFAAGVFALISMLWSSYRVGYNQGRSSALPRFQPLSNSPAMPLPHPRLSAFLHNFDASFPALLIPNARPPVSGLWQR